MSVTFFYLIHKCTQWTLIPFQLFLDGHGEAVSPDAEQKEIDFFKEHTEMAAPAPVEDLAGMTLSSGPDAAFVGNRAMKNGSGDRAGPNVEAALGTSPTNAVKPPSIIGTKNATRKPVSFRFRFSSCELYQVTCIFFAAVGRPRRESCEDWLLSNRTCCSKARPGSRRNSSHSCRERSPASSSGGN